MAIKRTSFVSFLILALSIVALQMPSANQAAAAESPPNGIVVTPARLVFSLSKDATEAKTTVTITNNYATAVHLVAEFKGIDTNAGLLIPTDDLDKTFNQSLHVSATDIILAPQQVYPLVVQMQNIAALAPGGHYATLVLTQQAVNGQSVGVRSQISLSVFGIKTAGEIQAMSLQSSQTDHWLFHLPTSATLTYRNTGNVHVVPRAAVSLERVNSAEPVIQGISNASSQAVFPGKTIKDVAPLIQSQHLWLPTRLQQIIRYRFDGQANPQTVSNYIWYVPPIYGWAVLGLLSGLVWRYRRKRVRATSGTPPQPLHLPAWTQTRPHKAIKVEEAKTSETVEVITPILMTASDVPPLKKPKVKRTSVTKSKRSTKSDRKP